MKHLLLWVALLACARRASAQIVQQPLAHQVVAPDEPSADCCRSRYSRDSLGSYGTRALGQEYQRLKRRSCAACNFYGSDLCQLMKALGKRLDGKSVTEIKRVMGPPDTLKGRVLVYYWRGEHDYLRFAPAKAGAVSSWYYALE